MTFSTDSAVGPGPITAKEFAQTARTSIQVTSRQGDVFRAEVFRCINVATDPELEEALRSGELFKVEGPGEDEPYELALPIRYHDEKNKVFALILPESLRHQEFQLRAEVLQDLGRVTDIVPDYIRDMRTIYGVEQLAGLKNRDLAKSAEAPEQLLADGGAPVAAPAQPRVELEEAWSKVEQEREQLARERQQLDEVRERIDRERARMDEIDQELSAERAELGELRSELQVASLNLEQKQMQLEQSAPRSGPVEATQVVTDDQFLEIYESVETEGVVELSEGFYSEPSEKTNILDTRYALGDMPAELNEDAVLKPCITRVDAVGVAKKYEGKSAAEIEVFNRRVVAKAQVPNATLDALESDELSFFVQGTFVTPPAKPGAESEPLPYPFVGLLLTALDDEDQATASVGWSLDVVSPDDSEIVAQLEEKVELHVALYNEAGDLHGVYEIIAPLHQNLAWIRRQIEGRFEEMTSDDPALESGAYARSVEMWNAEGFERLGLLRHNFAADSFADASTPAELSLAAGIVGFWSEPERYDYLLAHRSFPLGQFEAIQKRVVRRAVQQGICIGEALRALALEMSLAKDEVELAQRLVAEFVEISVGLRHSDLNPLQEWENWDGLLGLAEAVGHTLDPDVLELAEASLKRAQDYHDAEADGVPQVDYASDEDFELEEINHGEVDHDPSLGLSSPLVARRSETTGVTYFLPDDALLDTFDDLSEMSFDDLNLLLEDSSGRLEAAQMLVERFDVKGAEAALAGAEQMTATEVAALARFVEGKAEKLEGGLHEILKTGGPSATYIGARALAGIASEPAIPTLVAAFRDPARCGNVRNLARVIAKYGEALLPELKRSIKADGHDDSTSVLLVEMERLYPGLLARLAMDRAKEVRRAATAARESKP